MPWWVTRPHIRVGRYSFFLWAGGWSWPLDRQKCWCHSSAWYLGPFGFEIAAVDGINDDDWVEVSRPS